MTKVSNYFIIFFLLIISIFGLLIYFLINYQINLIQKVDFTLEKDFVVVNLKNVDLNNIEGLEISFKNENVFLKFLNYENTANEFYKLKFEHDLQKFNFYKDMNQGFIHFKHIYFWNLILK
ncbi:hypothetical protein NV226_01335 [Mycoplasma iguanae]|uniref:Transmembrane protein n=1 Tax=Mycoplasma iguanae TaxID=292461 RepID=A0ABY5R9F8_9MOLU|nr:hypothetical protein [Mycoplasma iguanae]UVD81931.1 hypothetical protein NV226_01335 [Mycoplasma iguanae]